MRAKRRVLLSGALASFVASPALASKKERVAMVLALGMDVSTSINHTEYLAQVGGYVHALRSEPVQAAIYRLGGIGLMAFDWAERTSVRVPWMHVRTSQDIDSFCEIFETGRRRPGFQETWIGHAIMFGRQELIGAPFETRRRVLDLSGDGPDSSGAAMARAARDIAVSSGIIINGLPILMPDLQTIVSANGAKPTDDLDDYYQENVIGGEGSFTHPAQGFTGVAQGMRRKLVQEMSA
jgi:hypothetical protein